MRLEAKILTAEQLILSAIFAERSARGGLLENSYPDYTYARLVVALTGSTTSVERVAHPSMAFQGGTSTQLYLIDSIDMFHTGYTGTGASSQAGWVSASLGFYLERVVKLSMRFRYDTLDMADNHRCYHGFTNGTPAYSTPADQFDTNFACLTAIGGTDTNWQLRTRDGSTVTTVDTGVLVESGVVYDVEFRYDDGELFVKMRSDGGDWSDEVSTTLTLPKARALRIVSYARGNTPSTQIALGNSAWSLVHKPGYG